MELGSRKKYPWDSDSYNSLHFLVKLTAVASIFVSASGWDCSYTKTSYDDTPCSDGYNEVYKEVFTGGQSYRLCCLPNSDDETDEKRDAPNCRATKCLMTTSGNLCSTLNERYIDNKKLVYEEVMRDPCVEEKHHHEKNGVVALCCQPNSNESLLYSMFGAEPHEFPHMAKVKPVDCGGTVYNKRFVITAAHCVVDSKTGKLKDFTDSEVVLGTNIGNMDLKSQDHVYKVKNVRVHEEYSKLADQPEFPKKGDGYEYNDIVLLEVDRDIQFSDKIKSLEIAYEGFDPFQWADRAVIAGWGYTQTLALSMYLHKTNFLLRSDDSCFQEDEGYWSALYRRTDSLLCVGGILNGQWSAVAAGGDSGGPAVCRREDGKPLLCGVTSFGGLDEPCVKKRDAYDCPPSVYTEVQHFHKWIKKHAGKQNSSTFYQPYLYGDKVSEGAYSHQVHITSTTGKSCGGTLVAPDVVVTAAQCVLNPADENGKEHSDLKVYTGINDLTKDKGKMYSIKAITSLPGFQRKGKPVNVAEQGDHVRITDNFYTNDLAVLKLNEEVDISEGELPRLPKNDESFFEGVEVALPRNTSLSGQMLSREFKLLQLNECQIRMDRMSKAKLNITVDRNVLCGVEKYSGGSLCDRELGGGLFCTGENNEIVLCGVQIFRLCEYSIPNAFINMALYHDWVKTAMEKMA